MSKDIILKKDLNSASRTADVIGSICPKCGFVGTDKEPVYTEIELMYENGIDDAQYGGALVEVEILHCPNCGG